MSIHTYTLTSDFAGGIKPGQLSLALKSDTAAISVVISTDEDADEVVITLAPDVADAEVDAVVATHAPKIQGVVKNFLVSEYSAGRLSVETWYAVDNGDGTYSDPVEKTEYDYQGNVLVSKTTTPLFTDGTAAGDPETWKYYQTATKMIMKRQGV